MSGLNNPIGFNAIFYGDGLMGLTVARAGQMEIFKKCKVLTGEAGLQNEILWVNILEILDDLSHIEPGEFLITTAHNLNTQSEAEQQNMIELFATRKLAAVAIQTGHYLEEIPPHFILLAKEKNIPLFEIPPEISFKSITRTLMNELVREDLPLSEGLERNTDSNNKMMISSMKTLWLQLLEKNAPEKTVLDLERFNIIPGFLFLVLALSMRRVGPTEQEQRQGSFYNFYRLVEEALAKIFLQHGLSFLIGPSESTITMVVQAEEFKTGKSGSEQIFATWLKEKLKIFFPGWHFMIGISSIHKNLKNLSHAQNEAEKALHAARLGLPDQASVVAFREMGFYRLLIELKNLDILNSIYDETAGPLIDYDRSNRGSLVETLETYLVHCNIKKSAEILYIHRHTMKYRLEQIEKLTGLNPLNPNDAFQLKLGLYICKYLQAGKEISNTAE